MLETTGTDRENVPQIERNRNRGGKPEASGIDLALRFVERYFGRDVVVAKAAAFQLEYQEQGWSRPPNIRCARLAIWTLFPIQN